jgi:uncharacterized protein (UPF0264 family)
MRLLVSVRTAAEARAALAGGADIIDAKEPLNGALGPVADEALTSIAFAVDQAAPVSAALGELDRNGVIRTATLAGRAGLAFVKVGFAGTHRRTRLADDIREIAAAARPAQMIVAAYADYDRANAPSPDELIAIADQTDAAGILLDTHDKSAPGLTTLMTARALRTFMLRAKSTGRLVAVAGRLTVDDFDFVSEAGADIVGVRGAACSGGRSGVIASDRVRLLRNRLDRASGLRSPDLLRHTGS